MRRRRGTSTAASGSSSSSSDGPDISARPSATRWRSPPDRSVTRRSSSPSISSMRTTRSRSRATTPGMPPVEQVAAHEHVGKERHVLRHVADVTMVRRQVDAGVRRVEHAPVDGDGAAPRRAQAGDRVEDRRLAGAGRAEERGGARVELDLRDEDETSPARARCRDRSRRAPLDEPVRRPQRRRTRSRPTRAAARAPWRPVPSPRSRRSRPAACASRPGCCRPP